MNYWDVGDRPCNLCVLRDIERRAARRGATVRTFPSLSMIAAQCSDEVKPAAYFMAVPERCACDE